MRFFRQSFPGRLAAGVLVAGMAAVSLSPHARAQELIRVVDAQGHQVGLLIRAPAASRPAGLVPMQSVFETMDRMMAQQMAMMRQAQQNMQEIAGHTLATAPVERGASYQSITSMSWGRDGATCSQTVTVSQNGQAAPVVHVSDMAGKAGCMQGGAASSTPDATPAVPQIVHHSDLVPAVDTDSVEGETKSTSSHM
ncbi:hypothetical protein [Acetobacter sp.]|jgi:hypothetical protein|uniref:hypothetical protein n=1 Tax=Acetobacter sp. TaxID=440 RepID=UPI0025C6E1CC|nr:hypothetical protein [Acetobacter sp.]MCH4090030.1 hypothetical protein [Acetobacter sp.]MCI1298726.1 hypothetical protein [Acetobacter sp.]MCI1315291.1 hypothetical protein [Acetobacter sp.]